MGSCNCFQSQVREGAAVPVRRGGTPVEGSDLLSPKKRLAPLSEDEYADTEETDVPMREEKSVTYHCPFCHTCSSILFVMWVKMRIRTRETDVPMRGEKHYLPLPFLSYMQTINWLLPRPAASSDYLPRRHTKDRLHIECLKSLTILPRLCPSKHLSLLSPTTSSASASPVPRLPIPVAVWHSPAPSMTSPACSRTLVTNSPSLRVHELSRVCELSQLAPLTGPPALQPRTPSFLNY
ncbi:uncharacterized protein LOC130182727 isoform X2 [Seriola aureovittata]|uniref:uncharacterized protein LOC130182727 isoform X2 n=1 Tax=Seriola aureovittata TaxID=2871759 RepID=UPI0024BD6CCC|nr:uncharacterized protein LOC130182727 isoform X2 [Seriola aureovittata]